METMDRDNYDGSESEQDLREEDDKKLLLSEEECTPAAAPEAPEIDKKTKPWRSIAAVVCLWIAYGICNAAFSLMGPFFPEEVIYKGISGWGVDY